jgi:hypothetical protein
MHLEPDIIDLYMILIILNQPHKILEPKVKVNHHNNHILKEKRKKLFKKQQLHSLKLNQLLNHKKYYILIVEYN